MTDAYDRIRSLQEELAQAQARILELEGLVREMVPFVRGSWCEERFNASVVVWPDWDYAKEILSRPQVRAIVEK